MNQKYQMLKALLKELFQLDQPDLDFGLYRVMHAKSAEVTEFLEEDLLDQVKDAFKYYETVDKDQIRKKLEQALQDARRHFDEPEDSKEVKNLRSMLEENVDLTSLANDVYNHLYKFFRRFYSQGDFLAKPVYKEGVYAIPYKGEELVLHWANKDQYYVKTSEHLQNYSFCLKPDSNENAMRVHFQLTDASEGEHANIKTAEEKNRVFVLAVTTNSKHDFLEEVEGELGKELIIRFEYRPATLNDWSANQAGQNKKPPKQEDLISFAVTRILATDHSAITKWIDMLVAPHTKANGEQADYSRLEAHLRRYTARNTFDYFIHKDLGGFLRRELDFYVKNEVMHLDDVENESTQRVESYLSKIKVIRQIAGKIIDFLAQLEDFQKKLWLKKKFVVETNYCITLDRVPEKLFSEILSNHSQTEEWVQNFAINEIKGDIETPEFSRPLSKDFLHANKNLILDTRWFSENFKHLLVASLDDIDEQCEGVLIQSENFQALNLLHRRFQHTLRCIYIDPPYNAQSSEILYKNNYKHSTWLSLMADRLRLGKEFLDAESSMVVAIDEVEQEVLGQVIAIVFPGWIKACIPIEHNPRGQQGKNISYVHEFAYFVYPSDKNKCLADVKRESTDSRNLRDSGTESNRTDAKKCFYPFIVRNDKIVDVGNVPEDSFHPSAANVKRSNGSLEIWPIDNGGNEKKWRYAVFTVRQILDRLHVKQTRSSYQVIFDKDFGTMRSLWKDAKFDASEYGTKLLQDILGKECAGSFSYPKSMFTVKQALTAQFNGLTDGYVLDFFSGSGTTAHAVIDMNREDGGNRKYILVEMGDYFDSVLKPRVSKVVYSNAWKDGIPCDRHASTSHCTKYLRLESFEDTLNNLEIHRTGEQQSLLDSCSDQSHDGFKETYFLRYMLDVETRGSQSLLNAQSFADPTAYKLNVKQPGSDESREVNVDLIETFNWLLGLTVRHIAEPKTFNAEFARDGEKRLQLLGRLKQQSDAPFWFRAILGSMPDGRAILVVWRKLSEDIERDNLVLDEWFVEAGYLDQGCKFDLIYVNGSNNLENLKTARDLWKVRLIEDDFNRLMFEMDGV